MAGSLSSSKDLSTFDPVAQSTPRKRKRCDNSDNNLVCPFCSKTYKLDFYYQRHLQSHKIQDPEPVVDNRQVDNTVNGLNISDLSCNATFKKPAIPSKTKKKVVARAQQQKLFTCTYCLKKYVSDKNMRKHMRTHTMQTAASRYPDIEDIVLKSTDIVSKALIQVANCPSFGLSGQKFKEVVGHVASLNDYGEFSTHVIREIVSSVDRKRCLLPSSLLKCLFEKMECVLNDEVFCAQCFSMLGISNFDADALSQFMLEFCLCVTSEIFNYMSQTFRSHYARVLKPMPEITLDERQVIYYVAGSIMRGYLRMANRYKGNLKWRDICSVLKSHALCSDPVGDVDAEWTKKQDRGGLLYINTDLQQFFISLTKLIYQNVKKNCSIEYDLIIKLVSDSDISIMWDNVFKDSLTEDVSVFLMNDVVSAFCKSCGRGIAKKTLNGLRNRPVISMPTRHAVASRKK